MDTNGIFPSFSLSPISSENANKYLFLYFMFHNNCFIITRRYINPGEYNLGWFCVVLLGIDINYYRIIGKIKVNKTLFSGCFITSYLINTCVAPSKSSEVVRLARDVPQDVARDRGMLTCSRVCSGSQQRQELSMSDSGIASRRGIESRCCLFESNDTVPAVLLIWYY